MRIAILANQYGALSETFVRREVIALQARGHDVAVFTGHEDVGPKGPPPTVPVADWTPENIRAHRPDVLYAQMGLQAHYAAEAMARTYGTSFVLRVWQGLDAFTRPTPTFYRQATGRSQCRGVIIEDEWMRGYATTAMRCDPGKLHVVPNSIDLDVFRPPPRPSDARPLRVLALARFVPKKGLLHLVRAVTRTDNARLTLVGYGPEESRLREAARGSDRIAILPPVTEAELPALYRAHDALAAPGVQMATGDADGVTTTTLEAMACGLPVVVTDLLSARQYVEHGVNGLVVPPGDEEALASALSSLGDARLRWALGREARRFAEARLDIRGNIERIEAVLAGAARIDRRAHWRAGVDELIRRRPTYSPERLAYYSRIADECLAILRPVGEVLDVGAGDGSMQATLSWPVTNYVGIDPVPAASHVRPGYAEALDVGNGTIDTALLYSVLQHVQDPVQALAEAHRVLRPGGRLAMQVCVDDPNPIFMWHWRSADVIALVEGAGFEVEAQAVIEGRLLCVRARRR